MSNQDRTLSGSGDADLLAMLVAQGHLTDDQAEQARRRMRRTSVPSHQAIVDLGFTSQEAVYRALSECSGLPFTVLAKQEILAKGNVALLSQGSLKASNAKNLMG